ncbi:isoliquiritigenin 2'-O-methyltransferase-like [Arachis stenosperma]|uniref:isoliquiritigenin 2'-O-methyltransferase-like n=1 Tax=Arachis stenosperma TaxID=217475 RepID=UPI0025ACD84A|nr:isoliquiritigenin 2'-O-methyltransferase-like [Arachis stenosperma]
MSLISKEEENNAFISALVLCFSRITPAIINAAIDLNLFEIIPSKGIMSASEIASKLPIEKEDTDMVAKRLERMLPSLASHSLLECSIRINQDGTKERVYALSNVGAYFRSSHHEHEYGGSLTPLSVLFHRVYDDLWKDAKDSILDPNNNHFERVYGMPMFEYLKTNKEISHVFDQTMAQSGPLGMKRIISLYKGFEGVKTLVDVGGGIGQTLNLIISAFPSIKGINFDMPHVVKNAPSYLGIEHVGGDMFESVPKGDAIMLKHVCHNWSDEECVKFLRNCHEALPQHGKVIVLDFIMPEIPNSSNSSKHICDVDYLMFIINGGKERTQKEFERLCINSGFSRFQVACTTSLTTFAVIEFYK